MERILRKLSLSKQEKRVLLLSMSGLNDREVAREIGVEFQTVRTYWNRIRSKIGTRSRAELIAQLLDDDGGKDKSHSAGEIERLRAEIATRRKAEEQFRAMAQSAPVGVFVSSIAGQCQFVNRAWEEIAGLTREEAMGDGWQQVVHPDDRERLDREWADSATRRHALLIEIRFLRPDGRVNWCQVMAAEMVIDDEVVGTVGTVRDVSAETALRQQLDEQIRKLHETQNELELRQQELERANERLMELAATDGLTGLKNYRSFQERLSLDLALAHRQDRNLTVVLLDVDRFKEYNDAFGHPAGDELLERLGQLLRSNIRQGDFVARYGGEEFALILPATDLTGAALLCDKLRRTVEAEIWPFRPVTASFGCAQAANDETNPAALVECADRALYAAKANGRNAVMVWLNETPQLAATLISR